MRKWDMRMRSSLHISDKYVPKQAINVSWIYIEELTFSNFTLRSFTMM